MNYKDYLGDSFDVNSGELDTEKTQEQVSKERDIINILLIGATGVGKSTLVNAFFGCDVAKVGVGKPVTQKLKTYYVKEKGLTLWDTKGIEAADYEETKQDLRDGLKNAMDSAVQSKTPSELPHVAWLCIKEGSDRVENREIELVKLVNEEFKIPVIVVFTKTQYEDGEEFVKAAESHFSDNGCNNAINNRYVRVNSIDYTFRGALIPKFGLDALLEATQSVFPEAQASQKMALLKAQRVDSKKRLDAMISNSKVKVHYAAAAAGTVGASPIPGSDAPLIAAVQGKLIYSINAEFQLDGKESNTTTIIAGILGVTALAQVGKTIVSTALKFIPGVGTLLGGAISAATAVAITEAVGHAYISTLQKYFDMDKGEVVLPVEASSLMETFTQIFKKP